MGSCVSKSDGVPALQPKISKPVVKVAAPVPEVPVVPVFVDVPLEEIRSYEKSTACSDVVCAGLVAVAAVAVVILTNA